MALYLALICNVQYQIILSNIQYFSISIKFDAFCNLHNNWNNYYDYWIFNQKILILSSIGFSYSVTYN